MIAAVDLGGTLLRTGWWQDEALVTTRTIPTQSDQGTGGLINQILSAIRSGPGVSEVVIATAGTLNPLTGHVYCAANLPLDNADLRDVLQDALGIRVVVIGDAVAATLSEFVVGVAKGVTHGAYVTLSTGIGLGMVIKGSLVSGLAHQAGELGHVPVVLDESAPRCSCGQRGCLELYSSGSGLAARYAELAQVCEPCDARQVLLKAQEGRREAREVCERGARYLGSALVVLHRILSPNVIVLGGGLTRSTYYTTMATQWMDTIVAHSVPIPPRLVRVAAHEPSNALIGAGLLGAKNPLARRMLEGSGFDKQLEGC